MEAPGRGEGEGASERREEPREAPGDDHERHGEKGSTCQEGVRVRGHVVEECGRRMSPTNRFLSMAV